MEVGAEIFLMFLVIARRARELRMRRVMDRPREEEEGGGAEPAPELERARVRPKEGRKDDFLWEEETASDSRDNVSTLSMVSATSSLPVKK